MIGHFKDPYEPIIILWNVMLGNPLLSIRHRLGMIFLKKEVDALENQDTTALIVALLAGALGAFIVSWFTLRWPEET